MRKYNLLLLIFSFDCLFAVMNCADAQATKISEPATSTGIESVIVTAPKRLPDAVINDFVRSYTAPSDMIGKIARWKDAICPISVGLQPEFNKFVTERVKEIAAMVGAPSNAKEKCRPNVEIVFTSHPQLLMNHVREQAPVLLGYHDTGNFESVAMVSHPIQAWYTTDTEDLNGTRNVDDESLNRGVDIYNPLCRCMVHLPNAREERIDSSLLGDGLRSELDHVIIVVDVNRIVGYELGSLADYIAVLSLSQTESFGTCRQTVSITNLMSPGCDSEKAKAIAEIDIAYLRGVYKMAPGENLSLQQNEIRQQMRDSLAGR